MPSEADILKIQGLQAATFPTDLRTRLFTYQRFFLFLKNGLKNQLETGIRIIMSDTAGDSVPRHF